MTVFARSDSLVLSIPSSSTSSSLYTEHFAFSQMPRSREPEIFTFEESPAAIPQPHRSASLRQRRKITRVMYPSKVRKYLPPAEKSPVKRWLIILCLVVCVQIYAEEGYTTESPAADSAAPDTTSPAPGEVELSFAEYHVLPFRSAELHARHMKDAGESSAEQKAERPPLNVINKTCPGPGTSSGEPGAGAAVYEQQSSGSCYVMALLYPVYHRLGSEQ
ncbi:radiation-inducible immediate-early gene IEX-1 [Scleropages formosus]|uniref:radiation-inducible immediate-early gene IEX-1 n=1 Tax=Scleropages formosus TaxID=113540 RepID=UPI0010FA6BD5|nr:radiation-inducible immediate-early gene IEX-1 [Scleropages formosus]